MGQEGARGVRAGQGRAVSVRDEDDRRGNGTPECHSVLFFFP